MTRRLAILVLAASFLATPALAADAPTRKEVDKAVERGLEYLRRTQEADGSWRGNGDKNAAITSLAVMAFLAAGHVPGEGKYGDNIERGIEWVMKAQQANGVIAAGHGYEMYHHGISTLMLAEVAGMTSGKTAEEVRQKLEKAVVVVLDAQRKSGRDKGGWRYTRVGVDADISVTGWQIMALRAAKNLGCDVPPEAIDNAIEYVLKTREPGTGAFRYQISGGARASCTGTAILALELCGKKHHGSPELEKAGGYMMKNPPRWGGRQWFFYEIYYGSQATFQLGGNYWSFYRPQLHEVLLRNQGGNGSWPVGDGHGANYATSMAILALTVEYRYLPIYQRGEEPTEK
jgi:hypothetical protein